MPDGHLNPHGILAGIGVFHDEIGAGVFDGADHRRRGVGACFVAHEADGALRADGDAVDPGCAGLKAWLHGFALLTGRYSRKVRRRASRRCRSPALAGASTGLRGVSATAQAAARVPSPRVLRIIGQGALRCLGRNIKVAIPSVAPGHSSSPMISTSKLVPYAHYTLTDAVIPELPGHYRGKVRENYDLRNRARILIAPDRVNAFDRNIAVIPLKGQVLTQTARFWFEATQSLCPNHVIEYPDPNVLVSKRLRMRPVKTVVRDYLAGTTSTSILQMSTHAAREMYDPLFQHRLR